jgi:hypothetical protein
MNYLKLLIITILCLFHGHLASEESSYLRDNLKRAQPGDYIVTAQNKTYTILHIVDKNNQQLTIEEISVPLGKVCPDGFSWKNWMQQQAPGHTAWVMYNLNLESAQIHDYYSFTKNSWYEMAPAENFLSTLLNLRLSKIPRRELKKIGPAPMGNFPDLRKPWQPKMIVGGREIQGVPFAAWKTQWPKDNSELGGKDIEVYVPEENDRYPSYFPYWLQISGMVGKAKVRIIDSGTGMPATKSRPSIL